MSNVFFERIVQRLTVLYGRQKVASLFGGSPQEQEATAQAWEAQLRQTDPETIRAVLNHLAEGGMDWPPNLAEWSGLCKRLRIAPEHKMALPMPPREVTEVGRQIIEEAAKQVVKREVDYLDWAKYPGTKQAVALLIRGAREDRRLRDILDHHLSTDGRDCRREDAVAAIRNLQASMRSALAAQEN